LHRERRENKDKGDFMFSMLPFLSPGLRAVRGSFFEHPGRDIRDFITEAQRSQKSQRKHGERYDSFAIMIWKEIIMSQIIIRGSDLAITFDYTDDYLTLI